MKISIGHLRQIIKEEIDKLRETDSNESVDDPADEKLAAAINTFITIENFHPRNRNLHEAVDETIAAIVAAIPLGFSAVKWGPSAWENIKDKMTVWLDNIYQVKQVMVTNRAIRKLFDELKNDKYLAHAMEEYRKGLYSYNEVIDAIKEIMDKFEDAVISPHTVHSSLEKGEVPKINSKDITFVRGLR